MPGLFWHDQDYTLLMPAQDHSFHIDVVIGRGYSYGDTGFLDAVLPQRLRMAIKGGFVTFASALDKRDVETFRRMISTGSIGMAACVPLLRFS